MKRIAYFLFLLVVCSVGSAYGDETYDVKLDNIDHARDMVSTPFCNIFVSLQHTDGEDDYEISVQMENTLEDKTLLLFHRSYSEQGLKGSKIVYDKFFPRTGDNRLVEPCERLPKDYQLDPSSEIGKIMSFRTSESTDSCKFPIYIARHEEKKFLFIKRSRYVVMQKEEIVLNIDVELKPDEDFVRLSEAADSLIEKIGRQTFCSNPNHRGEPAEKLFRMYDKAIDNLKEEVLYTINSRNYMSTDNAYKRFDAICKRLDAIDLRQKVVDSCPNDRKEKVRPKHSCEYCSLSAENIYRKLEAYDIDLHNGKKKKEQVMGDVEALYNCAVKNKKRSTGNYMSGISKYYKRIKSR